MTKNLLLIFCVLFSAQLFAQTCTPDPTYADSAAGVYPLPYYSDDVDPNGGVNVPACIEQEYTFVFEAVVPAEVTLPQGTFELNSVKLTEEGAVLNLPEGLDYGCNPPDCFFAQNTTGCVIITGTPTSANTPGIFDLKILAEVSLLGNQLVLNDTFPGVLTNGGNYFLELLDVGESCPLGLNDNHYTPFSVSFAPNPAVDQTTLTVEADVNNELTFQILTLTGKVIQSRVFNVDRGTNSFEINTTEIPAGMYWYSLGNEEGVLTSKILVTK